MLLGHASANLVAGDALVETEATPHQIDDLVQETLVSMHRKLATWDPSRPFLPWLAAIARYRWIDMLRRQRDEAELGDNDAAVGAADEAVHAKLSIDHLLALLPPRQAQAITLVKIEGASISEASRISGQSESLVKVGSETISKDTFYESFFDLVKRYLIIDQAQASGG